MVFDEFADRLAAEYKLLLFALAGRYQQLRAPGIEVSARAISDMQGDARALAATFYTGAKERIDAYARSLTTDAADARVVAQIEMRVTHLKSEVAGMLSQNLRDVARFARSGAADNVVALLRAGKVSGAMGELLQQKAGVVSFKSPDAAGRRWDAATLLRSRVRDFAYQAFLDTQAASFEASGVESMQTTKGERFELSDFSRVRATLFHPNSNSTMEQHVSS